MNLKEIANAHRNLLMGKSFDFLNTLPMHFEEEYKDNNRVTISVWSDVTDNDEIRVVVQASRYWIFGIRTLAASGFIKKCDGSILELKRSELYEFI